jgi:eukaryotic-like serine/threonine-protein kinase
MSAAPPPGAHPAHPPGPAPGPSDYGRLVGVGLILGVAAFAIGFLITALVLFAGGAGDDVVTVPDLRGRTEAEARQVVRRAELDLEVGAPLTNPEVPSGQVLAQSPLPGEEVAPGSTVRVTLSAGAEQRPVPQLRGMSGAQARALLTRSGFLVEVEERIDESPAGRILEVVPEPGTEVPMPGTVRLVVSAGPPRVVLPDVLGLPEAAARDILERDGFAVARVDFDPFSFQPAGTVIEQSPAGGSEVRVGTAVRFVVAGADPGNL